MLFKIYKGELFETHDSEIKRILEESFVHPVFGNAFLAVLLRQKVLKEDKIFKILRIVPRELI